MKNLFMVFVAVVSVTVCCVWIMATSPKWETVNTNNVNGGACYAFTTQRCLGGNIDCSETFCTSTDGGQTWKCNRETLIYNLLPTYNSACPTVESGGWTDCTTAKVLCAEIKYCHQSCVLNPSNNTYYCKPGDLLPPTPMEENNHYSENLTGC
ncbi:MAG: hypothetical protein LBP59_16655 [Planctomycetaceae bacterium]|jgi:hypothetical protein|nr:hypothetical protein [Planctomycetaceae bacterium]